MEYKAIVSFSGLKLSMRAGEVREISDDSLVSDLLKAGYIIPYVLDEIKEPETKEPTKKATKSASKGKGKAKS